MIWLTAMQMDDILNKKIQECVNDVLANYEKKLSDLGKEVFVPEELKPEVEVEEVKNETGNDIRNQWVCSR